MNYLFVAIGAGIGGALRYYLSSVSTGYFPVYFPGGTLVVNFLGSLILGVLIFAFDEKELVNYNVKLFLGVGFCGGLTTFSTFSLETFNLFKEAEFILAAWNIFLNLLMTLVGIYIGYLISR